jgi:hypothetical protein
MGKVNRLSADASSRARKRALRQLAHEQHAAYRAHYESLQRECPGLDRFAARGQAWTRLRGQFPDRYLELYAADRAGLGAPVADADIRTKSWQRASSVLADVCKPAYQRLFSEFRGQGMNGALAYNRAIACVREANPDLFSRLLAREYQLWSEFQQDQS